MKKSKFSDPVIVAALMSVEAGLLPSLLCSELGITMETFLSWKKTHQGMLRQAASHRETEFLMARLRKWQVQGPNIWMHEYLRAANLQAVFGKK